MLQDDATSPAAVPSFSFIEFFAGRHGSAVIAKAFKRKGLPALAFDIERIFPASVKCIACRRVHD